MTLKSGLEVTQGHWNWYHSKALVRVLRRGLNRDKLMELRRLTGNKFSRNVAVACIITNKVTNKDTSLQIYATKNNTPPGIIVLQLLPNWVVVRLINIITRWVQPDCSSVNITQNYSAEKNVSVKRFKTRTISYQFSSEPWRTETDKRLHSDASSLSILFIYIQQQHRNIAFNFLIALYRHQTI